MLAARWLVIAGGLVVLVPVAAAQESGAALAPPSPEAVPTPEAPPPEPTAVAEPIAATPPAPVAIPEPPGAATEPTGGLGSEADAVELDPSLVIETPEVVAAPAEEGDALASPAADREVARRLMRNLVLAEEALARERGSADWTMAIAVNLYVGGAMLGILTVSLIVGVILEAACVNGIPEECTDGPAFITGAIPSSIGAVALMIGAYTTERRASAWHQTLDVRRDGIEEQRREIEPRLSISPFGARLTF